MAKSGLKLIGISLVLMAIGFPLAKATDGMKGSTASLAIIVSLGLSLAGIATFLYGLVKLIVGAVKRG